MNTVLSASDAAALFDGSRLTLARQLAGKKKSEVARALEMSPTAVSAWEAGHKRPTASTVARLALKLGVDPGFFVVRSDDVARLIGAPHFRSLRSTTQASRDQATAYGQLAVDIGNLLERHVEFPNPDVPTWPVDLDVTEATPEEAARIVREAWGINDGPVGHLVRLLENHGVVVVYSPPVAASVDAYSFDSETRPVVILNPLKRDYYRQRFDVAHELGHLVMHSDSEPGGRIVEDQAQRFAAEFLMPEASIREALPTAMGGAVWLNLGKLKEHWGVSLQALLFRARRLDCISETSYRNAMTTISARGWRRQEPGQITTMEQPSMFPRAIELLSGVGIDSGTLALQTRVPRHLFDEVVARGPGVEATHALDNHDGDPGAVPVKSLFDRVTS